MSLFHHQIPSPFSLNTGIFFLLVGILILAYPNLLETILAWFLIISGASMIIRHFRHR